MHVTIIPADRTGCGHYRLIWPGQAVSLARPDWTVEIRGGDTVEVGMVDGRLAGVRGLDHRPDVLVMQRVGTPGQLALLRWASEQGIATVLDFDDAMWAIDRRNVAWKSWNGLNPWGQDWRICDEAAKVADLVTVTTERLAARYARHGRVAIIPNAVPKAATMLDLPEANGTLTAGWAGFTGTHPGDCAVSAPAARAIQEAGYGLRVVADAEGAAREWGVPADSVEAMPPRPFGQGYYEAVASLDLMLVGLRDTPFNQAKSTLKVLEAGAVGVPSIAPDNRPHRTLAGTGYPVMLADSPDSWRRHAETVMALPADVREEFARDVREYTTKHHTIEGNAGLWADAWERALKRKRG